MSTSSRSEQVWDLLHGAEALISSSGFVAPHAALPSAAGAPSEHLGYAEVVERYRDRLAFGTAWPEGRGATAPLALLLTMRDLDATELEFVRSWFENPKVNFLLDNHFWIQSVPVLAGEHPPYRELFEALCEALQPKAVFCLGTAPARLLLGAPLSLDTLRGGDFRLGSWPLLTTFDPAEYFAVPADQAADRQRLKGLIWKDIQRLVGKLRYA